MSSIGGIGGYGSSMMMQGMQGGMRPQRPDATKLADDLFSKLDTKGQGYIEKSDLQSAFDEVASSGTSGDTLSVDDVFASLDGDSDGRITKDEMSSSLQKLSDELDSQFNQMRMSGGEGMRGMPPPPPPPAEGGDAGFTQDELTSMASALASTDSQRAELMSNLAANFDEADSDGDGKISFTEAMAFDQASRSESSDTTTSASDGSSSESASSTSATSNFEALLMRRIMDLLHAYNSAGSDGTDSSGSGSLLSTTA